MSIAVNGESNANTAAITNVGTDIATVIITYT